MGAPIAAFLTLLISLLLYRRFVFRPAAPAVPQGLLDGTAIAALNRDRRQQLEQRRVETPVVPELLPLPWLIQHRMCCLAVGHASTSAVGVFVEIGLVQIPQCLGGQALIARGHMSTGPEGVFVAIRQVYVP